MPEQEKSRNELDFFLAARVEKLGGESGARTLTKWL